MSVHLLDSWTSRSDTVRRFAAGFDTRVDLEGKPKPNMTFFCVYFAPSAKRAHVYVSQLHTRIGQATNHNIRFTFGCFARLKTRITLQ